jgi:hypothetical protein
MPPLKLGITETGDSLRQVAPYYASQILIRRGRDMDFWATMIMAGTSAFSFLGGAVFYHYKLTARYKLDKRKEKEVKRVELSNLLWEHYDVCASHFSKVAPKIEDPVYAILKVQSAYFPELTKHRERFIEIRNRHATYRKQESYTKAMWVEIATPHMELIDDWLADCMAEEAVSFLDMLLDWLNSVTARWLKPTVSA